MLRRRCGRARISATGQCSSVLGQGSSSPRLARWQHCPDDGLRLLPHQCGVGAVGQSDAEVGADHQHGVGNGVDQGLQEAVLLGQVAHHGLHAVGHVVEAVSHAAQFVGAVRALAQARIQRTRGQAVGGGGQAGQRFSDLAAQRQPHDGGEQRQRGQPSAHQHQAGSAHRVERRQRLEVHQQHAVHRVRAGHAVALRAARLVVDRVSDLQLLALRQRPPLQAWRRGGAAGVQAQPVDLRPGIGAHRLRLRGEAHRAVRRQQPRLRDAGRLAQAGQDARHAVQVAFEHGVLQAGLEQVRHALGSGFMLAAQAVAADGQRQHHQQCGRRQQRHRQPQHEPACQRHAQPVRHGGHEAGRFGRRR